MNYLNLSHLLVPESRIVLQTRFRILQAIATYQPIGRRALAKVVQMSERTLRNECDRNCSATNCSDSRLAVPFPIATSVTPYCSTM